jgi:hypothetical protein
VTTAQTKYTVQEIEEDPKKVNPKRSMTLLTVGGDRNLAPTSEGKCLFVELSTPSRPLLYQQLLMALQGRFTLGGPSTTLYSGKRWDRVIPWLLEEQWRDYLVRP